MVEKINAKWIDEDALDTELAANDKMIAVFGIKKESQTEITQSNNGQFDLQASILAEVQKILRHLIDHRPKEGKRTRCMRRSALVVNPQL